MLGDRALDNRINKIRELDAQKKELEKTISALKNEIKEDMKSKGEEMHITSNYTIHFKEVVSCTFDSNKFKKEHLDLYSKYQKSTTSTRLIIHKTL